MKQRIADVVTDSLAVLLADVIGRDSPTGLYVVPTTTATVSAARGLSAGKGMHVVGHPEYFGSVAAGNGSILLPAQFLATCRDAKATNESVSALVFTDQFVSAEFAPILVSHEGSLAFFPSLESIASVKYGLPVHFWCGGSQWISPTCDTQGAKPVIQALSRYYLACNELGEAWHMRDRQVLRQPADRIDKARRRLRLYQSVIMLSAADKHLHDSSLAALKQLGSLRSALPALPRQ